MKTYTFRFREIERASWNRTICVKDEYVIGTVAELREKFGLKEVERISWADSNDPDSKPTKINTPQRIERFYNRYNSVHGKTISYIKG